MLTIQWEAPTVPTSPKPVELRSLSELSGAMSTVRQVAGVQRCWRLCSMESHRHCCRQGSGDTALCRTSSSFLCLLQCALLLELLHLLAASVSNIKHFKELYGFLGCSKKLLQVLALLHKIQKSQ